MIGESKLHNLILGAIFLGGLALIGVATLLVRGFGFEDRKEVEIRFDDVNNLARGEPVLVHGVRIGEVSEVRYDPEPAGGGDVLVVISIDASVPLSEKTEFLVRSLGPLGGKYLEIVPAPRTAGERGPGEQKGEQNGESKGESAPRAALPPRDTLSPPVAQGFFVRTAYAQVETEQPRFRGTAERDAFEQIGELVDEIRQGEGLLPRLLRDRELAATFEKAVGEFGGTFETLNQNLAEGRGLLPRLLRDEALGDEVANAVTEIRRVFTTLNAENGLLQDLEATADDLRVVVNGVRNGQGVAGLLFTDAAAREKVDNVLTELSTVAERIGDRSSLLGRVVNDEEMAQKFASIVDDVAEITDKANHGEGILPQLLNDAEAWAELRRILVLARESIEDLREQAPISTFANVLFAVF